MNIALILAGGCGSRTQQDVPKQFMNVYEKPLIIYTLENFQQHPDIDGILVVCLEGWHEVLRAYARQYQITKLKWVVSGGSDGQESTQKGMEALRDICQEEDVVIVHDGIRPFITPEVICDAIAVCQKQRLRRGRAYGCAEKIRTVADSPQKLYRKLCGHLRSLCFSLSGVCRLCENGGYLWTVIYQDFRVVIREI